MRRVLLTKAYSVIVASSPADALQLFASSSLHFTVLRASGNISQASHAEARSERCTRM
jgi:hypothetical protein